MIRWQVSTVALYAIICTYVYSIWGKSWCRDHGLQPVLRSELGKTGEGYAERAALARPNGTLQESNIEPHNGSLVRLLDCFLKVDARVIDQGSGV